MGACASAGSLGSAGLCFIFTGVKGRLKQQRLFALSPLPGKMDPVRAEDIQMACKIPMRLQCFPQAMGMRLTEGQQAALKHWVQDTDVST